ncbi:uncharacterized protein [Lepeophtheirus salmonis]|uniref:uncharacterized protein n=1 Tax=Lepeophtheirus salmonis TaxID=72036 RepID=UPI001AE7E22E|nr:outer dynein arm-docking complex subunit 4-like [Lepeophtheirus salmonis]
MRRSDYTYKEIKSQIHKRAKNSKRKVSNSKEQVESYVDSSRGISGVPNYDLKSMIQKCGIYGQGPGVFSQGPLDSHVYVKQSRHLMKKGCFSSALHYLNMALRCDPTSPVIQTARAKCHLQMGNWELAQIDADAVLSENGNYLKAIFAKAESLYNTCKFEHALVLYHRGLKLAIDKNTFHLGIRKCCETILNCLAKDNSVFCNEDVTEIFLNDIIESSGVAYSDEDEDDYLHTGESDESLIITSTTNDSIKEEQKTENKAGKSFSNDKKYLLSLAMRLENMDTSRDMFVEKKLLEETEKALLFLKDRESFWKQLNVGN